MKQMATAKRQGFWDLRAAGNFIGGGTGTGLVLVSTAMAAAGVAPYDVTNPNAWLPPNNGGNFANHRPSR